MRIKDIVDAISVKINQSFGDDYTIYVDEVPQGFQTPAFFIQLLDMGHIRQIGGRWKVTPLFNVQYFPEQGASESADAALKVQQALKAVNLLNGVPMLARGASSEVVDGNAHNFMRFDFFLQEIEAKELMGEFRHYVNGNEVATVGEE